MDYKTLGQLPLSRDRFSIKNIQQESKITIKDRFYLYHINLLEARLQEQEMLIDKLLKHNELDNDISLPNHSYTNINESDIIDRRCTICSLNFNKNDEDYLVEISNDDKIIKSVHNKCLDRMTNFKFKNNILWKDEIDFNFKIKSRNKII